MCPFKINPIKQPNQMVFEFAATRMEIRLRHRYIVSRGDGVLCLGLSGHKSDKLPTNRWLPL